MTGLDAKLAEVADQYDDLQARFSLPETTSDPDAMRRLCRELARLEPGDAIRIPRKVRHWARCIGTEPLFALIIFSSGKRTAINHEDEGTA